MHYELITNNYNGDDRGRTGNLRLAKPALSQLSYVPGTQSDFQLPISDCRFPIVDLKS